MRMVFALRPLYWLLRWEDWSWGLVSSSLTVDVIEDIELPDGFWFGKFQNKAVSPAKSQKMICAELFDSWNQKLRLGESGIRCRFCPDVPILVMMDSAQLRWSETTWRARRTQPTVIAIVIWDVVVSSPFESFCPQDRSSHSSLVTENKSQRLTAFLRNRKNRPSS
jgi:hypothetical protein